MQTLGLGLGIAAVALSVGAWGIFDSWIKARTQAGQGPMEGLGPDRKAELLATENEALKGQVSRLEERIAVLERIATDPATRTAREIENLRQGDI